MFPAGNKAKTPFVGQPYHNHTTKQLIIIIIITHYLLDLPTYTNERITLLNKIKSINCSILEFIDAVVTTILSFVDNTLSDSFNTLILNSTIDYIISTKRFDDFILTPVTINKKLYLPLLLAFLFFYFWNNLVYISLLILV